MVAGVGEERRLQQWWKEEGDLGARVWRRGASRCYIGEEEANGCGIGLPMATLAKPADAGMAPPPRLTNGRARRYGEGGGDADEWVRARKKDKNVGST